MMESKSIVQFVPFRSFVHGSFWHKLAEIKLDIDRLSDASRTIFGYYSNSCARNTNNFLEIDCTSFNHEFKAPAGSFACQGILLNKNTIEDFKNCSKLEILKQEADKFWCNIFSDDHLSNTHLLAQFILLSFADLKKHNYYYWFAFPALREPLFEKISDPCSITKFLSIDRICDFTSKYFDLLKSNEAGFFIFDIELEQYYRINEKINHTQKDNNFNQDNLDNLMFCYSDPSESTNGGWILRNFICYLSMACPILKGKTVKFLSIREENLSLDRSLVFKVFLPNKEIIYNNGEYVGWEPSTNEKMIPRLSEMGKSMDPLKLAESSVNLNLKLLKWRLLPDLDLEIIANTKCLLMGAGTLGCGVARTLMAWGVNQISLIDYGNVAYSNPVRQNLFLHADAINGGKKKALIAASRLKEIHPGVQSKGYSLQIPMPGHPVGESLFEKTIQDICLLKSLVQEHDAIFLLTDSRESRWMPTLLGAFYDKIVINAALGFDSYLVMRHGSKKTENVLESIEVDGLKCVPGNRLGCYFCNDVIAPGNSLKDRTLDQQCTVTRPSVSNIASSLAAELLVAILQHKDKELAPAYYQTYGGIDSKDIKSSIPEGILGIIPHSIRGTLSSFEQILPATERFSQCIACSDKVLGEFKRRDNEFLFEVFDSAKILEDLTGITEMLELDEKVIQFDDSDDFAMSD